MDKNAYLSSLHADAERLASVAADGLTLQVPGCPDWTTGDLVVHLAEVYEWVSALLEAKAVEGERDVKPIAEHINKARAQRKSDSELRASSRGIEWFKAEADRVIGLLDGMPSDERMWTWWPTDQTVGFWQRRMAQETAVHRWDVESAHGQQTEIVRGMARDGIDEILEIHMPAEYEDEPHNGKGERYLFSQTDGDGIWMVVFDPGDLRVEHASGGATLSFAGTASDLLLMLWRRLPAPRFLAVGDPAGLAQYYELLQVDS